MGDARSLRKGKTYRPWRRRGTTTTMAKGWGLVTFGRGLLGEVVGGIMLGISEGVGDMIADSEIGMHMRLDRSLWRSLFDRDANYNTI